MRVVSDANPDTAYDRLHPSLLKRIRAFVLRLFMRFGSDVTPSSGYRVTPELLYRGEVGVGLSVLLRPLEELEPAFKDHDAKPEPWYFDRLMEDVEAVELDAGRHSSQVRVVKDRAALAECRKHGLTALVHCVEGGFHLGADLEAIPGRVRRLKAAGVAYITVAHLFSRGVSDVAPALPWWTDEEYFEHFEPKASGGLTDIGRTIVRAMAEAKILVDVSHMQAKAVTEAVELVQQVDPALPVISTHAGYRFGDLDYMHDDETIEAIANSGGMIGLILGEHLLLDGFEGEPKNLDDSVQVLVEHIEKIKAITGTYRHVGLGSDLDGFVRPTLPGIDTALDLVALERGLRAHYKDDDVVDMITHRNALRVLEAVLP